MSLTVTRIKDKDGLTLAFNIVVDTQDSMERFIELVHRATNLWPDATPEVKEFADRVTNNLYGADGRVQQDYRAQDTSGPRKLFCTGCHASRPMTNKPWNCVECGVLNEFNHC